MAQSLVKNAVAFPGRVLARRRLGRPGKPIPFIVGMTRSGTTLLRLMLDSHPNLAIPPETHFVPNVMRRFRNHDPDAKEIAKLIARSRRFDDFGMEKGELRRALRKVAPLDDGRALRAFYDLYARKQGKRRFGDKTPGYAVRMKRIAAALPEAKFIHVIRDGRDVALSVARKEDDPPAPKKVAVRWRRRINGARNQVEDLAEGRYLEVRYEDLVTDTEAALRRICEFIDLPFHSAMLDYYERADERLAEIARPLEAEGQKSGMDAEQRVEAHSLLREPPRTDRIAIYKREMSDEDRAACVQKAGELLEELGYEVSEDERRRAEELKGNDSDDDSDDWDDGEDADYADREGTVPATAAPVGDAQQTGTVPVAKKGSDPGGAKRSNVGGRFGSDPVRVGIVTKWFNRGQPVVGRYLRTALDELGHETHILAKPKKERGPQKGALSRDDVWDQPGVTEASQFETPYEEYAEWVEENGIEAVYCDQNYQFDELAKLRDSGVLTIGRFVWEHFSSEHVDGALRAYDVIYSFTKAERDRYAQWGIDTPYIPWGIHPELLEVQPLPRPDRGTVELIFPGGFIGHRKPLEPVVEAFAKTTSPDLRLTIKAQVERKTLGDVEEAAAADERLELLLEDQPTELHQRTVAGFDAAIAPSRWEGLGLPLYESVAWEQPVVTNDVPPMNEVIEDERNGLLVPSIQVGTAKSGIPSYDPDLDALAEAMERLADRELRERLSAGAREVQGERPWSATVEGLGKLLERARSARTAA